jgi:F-type H+-transporting ATPase subunit b
MRGKWFIFAAALVAAPAMAAEGGGNVFAGDIGNAIWTLVVFGLVLVVLGKFAWGPMLEGLQEREKFIHDSLEEAKRDREAAEARLAQYEEKLNAARAEATDIVAEGRRDAEAVKQKIEDETREETRLMIDRAKREIDLATQTAKGELFTAGAKLATDMASRIIGKEMSPEDHERLIAESIDKLGDLETN